MIKRLYIVAFISWLGIAFSHAQAYHLGDVVMNPDGSRGIVFYINPEQNGGWIAALDDASASCQWGADGDIPDLTNHEMTHSNSHNLLLELDGYGNTQTIRAYQNNNPAYAAGTVDIAHGWYLPTAGQLRILISNLALIETSFSAAGGSSLYRNRHYWTSTEINASQAWFISSNSWGGYFTLGSKSDSYAVRAVHDFTMTPPPIGEITYLWNTGATSQNITVSPTQTTTYSVTVSAGDGCESTANKSIIVTPGYSIHIYQQVCDSYTWNGVTYNATDDYTQQFTSQSNCDSIVTLHLTVTGPPMVSIMADEESICEGETVNLHAEASGGGSGSYNGICIGDILCTDGSIEKLANWPVSGKTAKGIVVYLDATNIHGWAVGLNDLGTSKWCQQQTDVAGLTNYDNARSAIYDFDGYGNTQIIRAAGNESVFPAAWMVDYDNGWYLPAVGQWRYMYPYLYSINASLAAVNGTQFPVSTTWWYWSSTESTAQLKWDLDSNGYADRHNGTSFTWRVRAMCSF